MKKEKKIYFKILLFLLNIFLLTSCIFIKEDREGMKKVCDNVVDSCFSKNKDDIKKFFAPNIVEQVKNIDQEISDLQNYLTGDLTNYDYSYPGSEETSYSKGKKQVYIYHLVHLKCIQMKQVIISHFIIVPGMILMKIM